MLDFLKRNILIIIFWTAFIVSAYIFIYYPTERHNQVVGLLIGLACGWLIAWLDYKWWKHKMKQHILKVYNNEFN